MQDCGFGMMGVATYVSDVKAIISVVSALILYSVVV
jgi:hypothetical protein